MKILCINGSPRGKNSNTDIMVEQFLNGAAKAGAETEMLILAEKKLGHCKGCFECWQDKNGRCVIRDDMDAMLKKYIDADFVIYAFPLYGNFVPGLLKDFMDRTLPLANPRMKRNNDGTFYHEGRISKFPQFLVISNCGFPGDTNFEFLKIYFKNFDPVLEIYRNCGEILKVKQISFVKQYLDELYHAGVEFANSGKISGGTSEKLSAEIISYQQYMEFANKNWDEVQGESHS